MTCIRPPVKDSKRLCRRTRRRWYISYRRLQQNLLPIILRLASQSQRLSVVSLFAGFTSTCCLTHDGVLYVISAHQASTSASVPSNIVFFDVSEVPHRWRGFYTGRGSLTPAKAGMDATPDGIIMKPPI